MSLSQVERRARARGVSVEDHRSAVQARIDGFNNDQSRTHSYEPDSRHHYRARFPILADDCDFEIVGFSDVQGMRL